MPTDNNESYDGLGNSLQDRKTRLNAETAARPAEQGISLHNRPTRLSGPTQSKEAEPPSGDGRYVDRVEIGRGGMGVVWKAHDVKLDRLVAIKRVLPGMVDYDGVVSRFLAEARALAKVTHPNIVGIYDQGHDEFGDYIVMEYVEGANLLELIKQRTTLSVDDSVRLIRKICEGLHEAHRAGIIHRDIKPSNILVDKNGRAKLTDFGLARLGGSQGNSLSGQVLGTEGYMAPEQYENPKNATAASDQYSLAATLYHMVTGRSPRMIHLRNVPDVLQDILSRALDEHTDQRFPSIAAFHAALGQIPRSGAVQANTTRAKVPASESTEGDSNLANLYAELRKKAEASLAQARKCFDEYEDVEALAILKSIPDELRDKTFEQRVSSRLERGKQLEKEIGQRVREMKTNGLRLLVEEFLQLCPKRKDMVSLRGQLLETYGSAESHEVAEEYRLAVELPNSFELFDEAAQPITSGDSHKQFRTLLDPDPNPSSDTSLETGEKLFDEYVMPKPGRAAPRLKQQTGLEYPPPPLPPSPPKLMVSPFDSLAAEAGQKAWAAYLGRPVQWTNSIGMKFGLIPPGEFLMGASNDELLANAYEKPRHRVRITKPFYVGIYPVTQEEYLKVTVENPSHFRSLLEGALSWPIEQVSWEDTQAFIKKLMSKERGYEYRLPTEAEWEYSCRAGTTTPFWFGGELNGHQANCNGNNPYGTSGKGLYLSMTTSVGQYSPNPFGVYDHHGQVQEWCQDRYSPNYYEESIVDDPKGPVFGSVGCVLRGGAWDSSAMYCRSACRSYSAPTFRNYNVGFRVVAVIS